MVDPPQLPNGYRFTDGSLYQDSSNRPLSNFYLIPTAAYCLNGEPIPSFCDIGLCRGNKLIPLAQRISLTDLPLDLWKKPPPGCVLYPGTHGAIRHLQTLFHLLLDSLETTRIFQPTALGWTRLPSGEAVYTAGNGVIGADGFLAAEHIWIPEKLSGYRLEQAPSASPADAQEYFWTLFQAAQGITAILLANTLSAILFPCFKEAGLESRFPIILEGPSESKKTTLACLTSSLYNRKSALRSCMATLTSTKSALEIRGADLRHAVLIFDDLFPDGGNSLAQKALELIRDIANQRPREARSGKSVVGAELECGAVITAEEFPACGKSTRTRCLRLVLNEPILNQVLEPLQRQPELLGNVFMAFITYVAGHFGEISEQIKEDFQAYRARRSQPNAAAVPSERLAEIGFVLHTSLKIFLSIRYGPEQMDGILDEFTRHLNSWIAWQLSPGASPEQNSITALLPSVIQNYPSAFIPKGGFFCIPLSKLCNLLQRYIPHRTITEKEVLAALRNEKVIRISKGGDPTEKIPGIGRCLYIDPRRLPH